MKSTPREGPEKTAKQPPRRGRPIGSKAAVKPVKPVGDSREWLRIPEVVRLMGIGKSTIYDRIEKGLIPTRKIGGIRLIHIDFVRDRSDVE